MPRSRVSGRLFLAAMLVGAAFITASSLAYFDFETLPPFVIERLPERFASLWLTSLRVHVAAALVSLPLCLLLTTRALQARAAWHRWIGRATGVLVLFALVPSGVVLAFHAKGGAGVSAGFLLSAAIVAWFMARGILAARGGDLVSHRRAMRHVVGQMSVAVTSRALLLVFDAGGIDPDLAYVVALWGPVLASAAVVEILSARKAPARRPFASFAKIIANVVAKVVAKVVERIRRDLPPLDRPVRARSHARPFAGPRR